ncbi:MAG: nucleotide exchange factor GrpE [Cyanobacteria bacterium J06632_22]
MVEDVNPTETPQAADGGDSIEELTVEDADVEIDFDSDFSAANSEAGAEGENSGNAGAGVSSEAVAELEQRIAALTTQVEERTNQCLRINADFDNFRNRTSREKEELESQVKRSTIRTLLEVVDNFERARSQIKPQTDGEMTIHKSYQGVYKQLVEALKKLGVSPMRAEGEEFDPNLHEAVMREPSSEYPEGTVIEQLVRGYLLGDKVLRHAMVKVAMPPEPAADEATENA